VAGISKPKLAWVTVFPVGSDVHEVDL